MSKRPLDDDAFARLRADVDFLGSALGNVLKELEGEELFDLVERVRSLTKALRVQPGSAEPERKEELQELLEGLSLDRAERVLRAFTVYFQLINVAEEIHRVRVNRLREGRATPDAPRRESVASAVKVLKDQGWSGSEVRRFVEDLDIGLTMTAHPTEVKRYTVRLKLERIGSAMRRLSEQDLSPRQRQALEDEIYAEITTLWQTRELFAVKPTVIDEVKSALYYFRRSLLQAVPQLMLDMENALTTYFGDEASADGKSRGLPDPLPQVIRFRSWIGGDRDGNPFVLPETTREAYRLQAEVALQQAISDVDGLVQRLSQWERRVPLGGEFRDDLAALNDEHGPPERFPAEPFRQKLYHMHAFLREEAGRGLEDVRGGAYPGGSERYEEDLRLIEQALAEGGGERAARAFVRPLRYRASAFGLHLAAIDLREHSRMHEAAVADLLAFAGVTDDYANLPETERVALLDRELASRRPLSPAGAELEEVTERALAFLRVFREARKRYGAHATGSYIVSMTEGVSDVLEVLILAKQAGYVDIDVTPLFETEEDLDRAPEVLEELFSLEPYRRHVETRGIQEVMIGYSDSNKDAGFLAANWALFRAQEGVARVCREAGISLRLFHGRGTSIGRGGGPSGQAILAQPPGSLNGRMRLTEQGEALSERYTDPDLAHRHLEQVAHAFILSSARDARPLPELPVAYREAMGRASESAQKRYRQLLESPGFLDFFHQVTPIEEISRLQIGSRPVRRKGDKSLENLRAIPWVFSWTQCRANLPGWFGLGSGLAVLEPDALQEMYREWPFFRTILDFAQMSLAKADLGIFESYLQLVDPELRERFWPLIREEHRLSVERVELATGSPLLEHDSTLARAIELRNPYVDPISHLQVELIKRLRAAAEQDEDRKDLEYAVQVTLIGISAGLRNTG